MCGTSKFRCNWKSFSEVIDVQAGRCWCIFCDEEREKENGQSHIGIRELSLLLDTEPEEHIEETSDGDGFLIKIHQPGLPPFPLIGNP